MKLKGAQENSLESDMEKDPNIRLIVKECKQAGPNQGAWVYNTYDVYIEEVESGELIPANIVGAHRPHK